MCYLPSFRYAFLDNHITELIVGSTDKQPLLETPGEVILISLLFFALLLSVVYLGSRFGYMETTQFLLYAKCFNYCIILMLKTFIKKLFYHKKCKKDAYAELRYMMISGIVSYILTWLCLHLLFCDSYEPMTFLYLFTGVWT